MASSKVVLVATAVLFWVLMACVPPPQAAETPALPVTTATPIGTAVPTAAPTDTAIIGPGETPTSTSALRQICQGAAGTVVLILDPALQTGIRGGLDLFEGDLCTEGHAVVESLSDFGSAEQVRSFLAGLYTSTAGQLAGAILIGDIPYAYQYVTMVYSNPDIPPLEEEAISFQYYADLDGAFEASSGYTSPGGHSSSYDVHSGEVDWEIWIGVLPLYKGDSALTVEALSRYLEKNHAFRTGASTVPHGFLEISEHFHATTMEEHESLINGLVEGQYAWTPLSNTAVSYIYFDSAPGGLSIAQGYQQLSAGVCDITVGDAHGYWGAHGSIDAAWVDSNGVKTVLFWSNGCAVGNLDYADNFLSSILYSPASMVLVAKGTSNDSGGMGNNQNGFFGHNIAVALVNGESVGEAILEHVNVPLIPPWSDSREFHFGTAILLGDPTLRLRP